MLCNDNNNENKRKIVFSGQNNKNSEKLLPSACLYGNKRQLNYCLAEKQNIKMRTMKHTQLVVGTVSFDTFRKLMSYKDKA